MHHILRPLLIRTTARCKTPLILWVSAFTMLVLVAACTNAPKAENTEPQAFVPVDSIPATEEPKAAEPLPDLSQFAKQDGHYILDWDYLSMVEFEERYNEEMEFEIPYPIFSPAIKAFDGQPIIIQGYVIPLEETGSSELLVLSAFPYSSCFFCGTAGPESVMDIQLANPAKKRFKMDEITAFKGKLRLNDSDIYYLNYILDDASPVKLD